MFISRPSLWTCFRLAGTDKTRVYLERSKSSPIDLRIDRDGRLSPSDPLFYIDPPSIRRFKSLIIHATPDNLHDIATRLYHPAPLLESLTIEIRTKSEPNLNPAITPALFDGNLSSLRELDLQWVRTELPWRNMINLTSFVLAYPPPGEISTKQLLDFLESSPRLHEVELYSVTLIPSDQDGRLVPLAHLKRLTIHGDQPTSPLFDHLLIPVSAALVMELDPPHCLIEDHLPRSLDNLRNLSNFTQLRLYLDKWYSDIQCIGPNGKVCIVSFHPQGDGTGSMLESLARFDTSTVERLDIFNTSPLSGDLPRRALLPMKALRTLTTSRWKNILPFIRALDPDTGPSDSLICPKLEELVLPVDMKGLDIESVVGMATARASRGVKLKSVKISNQGVFAPADISKLRKHVVHVDLDFEDVDEEWG